MRQQQRLCRHLDRLLRHVLGRVRDIADKAEPVTGADHFGAEFGQTLMGNRTGLKIADVVRRVMHELHMPDAPPMRLLEPFQLAVEEIEPLYVGYDRRLSRLGMDRQDGDRPERGFERMDDIGETVRSPDQSERSAWTQ